jgi:hypothetical protein
VNFVNNSALSEMFRIKTHNLSQRYQNARSKQSSEKCEEPVENVSKIRAMAKIKNLKN